MNAEAVETDVLVTGDEVNLPGTLTVPGGACGVVVFAHGSGSSRLSTRNVAVARALVDQGCATLLFDLLTSPEAADRGNVFDIDLLGRRVLAATAWLRGRPDMRDLPVGYFGASTGAAAGLVAAADLGDAIAAVVSRGGRPDLAIPVIDRVTAPTLLLVGSLDGEVLGLNRNAQGRMRAECRLTVIDGAGHLFEEPGTLDEVSAAAGAWFVEKFRIRAVGGPGPA
ncbi:MAG: dienelactone hydrolase family protein [Planctomycetota bacterium]|jgi:pimeloyl-ACP methyl ester carboxylesterase